MDYDERSAGLTPSNVMAVDKDLAFAHRIAEIFCFSSDLLPVAVTLKAYLGTITSDQSLSHSSRGSFMLLSSSFSGPQIFALLNPFALLNALCCAMSSTFPLGVLGCHPQTFI